MTALAWAVAWTRSARQQVDPVRRSFAAGRAQSALYRAASEAFRMPLGQLRKVRISATMDRAEALWRLR